MLAPELLAAMASGCWAVGALFSANASNSMGAFAFTRWRLFFAMCMLWMAAFYVGRWPELTLENIAWLSVSSWVGILVGDTALFVCMNRLGPRRSGVLFATHALFSALFAWLFFTLQRGCSDRHKLKTTDNLNLSLSKLNEDRILTKYLEELKFPKIKRVSKIPNYLFKDWYSPLIKWLSDGKLTIDVVKAQKILEMNNIKTFEPDKYLEYLAMIDIFKEKDFNLKSDKNFRFYSSLTNLPKILRGCLLYSGKKLAGTDVSNTQPLFLGTLCDRLFLKELRAKKNIDVDDILFNEFILHLESNPKDLIQFNKLVQTGNLYESFTDIGQEFTREIIKDNLIKVINDKGIDKNKYKVAIRRALNERFPTISLLLNMLKSKNHKYVSSTLMSIEAQNFVINFPHEFYYKPEHSHIPLFMVHDCFFTIEQHIDYLENFIKEYYKSYLSIDLPMKREKMV